MTKLCYICRSINRPSLAEVLKALILHSGENNIINMKVKDLIKELKKMPQESTVAFRDHDQSESELNTFINHVSITDFS